MSETDLHAAGEAAAGKRPLSGRQYTNDYAATAIRLGALGWSRAEIAAELGRPVETLALWEAGHAQFAEAMALARTLALAWWEARGREGIETGRLNATLWAKNMAGRFPEAYGERAAIEAARKAAHTARPRRTITDLDRAKAVAHLMAQHPQAFAALKLEPPRPSGTGAEPEPRDVQLR